MEWYSKDFLRTALKCKADDCPVRPCTEETPGEFGLKSNSEFENVRHSQFNMTGIILLWFLCLYNGPLFPIELDMMWHQATTSLHIRQNVGGPLSIFSRKNYVAAFMIMYQCRELQKKSISASQIVQQDQIC